MTAGEVATATGLGRASVSTTLSKLAKSGEVTKAARGYQLAGQTARRAGRRRRERRQRAVGRVSRAPERSPRLCVVAICENGVVRSAGRVASIPEGISALGESLLSLDRVALEVTGSCWEVAGMCLGIGRVGAVTRLGDCQLVHESGVAFWLAHVLVAWPNLNAHSSAARSTCRASRSYTCAASTRQTGALRRELA
jgi:hypothetical protein